MNNFTCTSDKAYDRHTYEIVLNTGKSILFDNWYDTQSYWFQHCQIPDFLSHINVKDKEKVKSKGFG